MKKIVELLASVATVFAAVVACLAYLQYEPNFLDRCDPSGNWVVSLYARPNYGSVFKNGHLMLSPAENDSYTGKYKLVFEGSSVEGNMQLSNKLYGMWASQHNAQGTIELKFYESCDHLLGEATRNTKSNELHHFKWHFQRI